MTTFRKTQPETVTPDVNPPVDAIRLRRAEWADVESLFQWRNHDDVRRYSLNAALIDWDTHCTWLRQSLSNPLRVLLIGELPEMLSGLPKSVSTGEGATHSRSPANESSLGDRAVSAPSPRRPVGVLRYDLQEDSAVVSVYLVPEQRGHGYGPRLLRTGSYWMRQEYPAIKRLLAAIRTDNPASLKAFETAGYQKADYQGAIPEKVAGVEINASATASLVLGEAVDDHQAEAREMVWYAYEY